MAASIRQTMVSQRAQAFVVGSCIVLLALALGGAHVEVVTGLAVVLAGVLLLVSPDRAFAWWKSPPFLAVLLALAATLVQLVPIPVSWMGVVSPGAQDSLRVTFGGRVDWAPLTMDVPATAGEIVKLVAYLCGGVLAVTVFSGRGGRRQLVAWICAAGGAVTLLGFAHALADATLTFGAFGRPSNSFVSSFINPNHLACFLGFSSVLSLGLMMGAHGRMRWLYLANVVLCGSGVFLSLSRGAMLAYGIGVVFLLVLQRLRTRDGRGFRNMAWTYGALAGGLLVAAYVAYTRILRELLTVGDYTPYSKTEIWQPWPDLVRDSVVLGVGRGAFAAVYPRYRPQDLRATFTYLENEWLQTIVDWGPLIGGTLLLLGVLAFFRLLRRRQSDPLDAAVPAGFLLLGVHNLVDFNLEVAGIALPAFMLLCRFSGPLGRRRKTDEAQVQKRAWWPRAVGVAALLVVAAAAIPAITYDIERDTRRAVVAVDAGNETAIAAFLGRHPADYIVPFLVAQRLLRQPNGAREAIRWVNIGMYHAPGYGPGHRLAGRALARVGHQEQALLEYRLACTKQPSATTAVAAEVFAVTRSPEAVAGLASAGPEARVRTARFLLGRGHNALAASIADGGSNEESASDLERIATIALAREGDLDGAVERAENMVRRWPWLAEGYWLQGQVMRRQGRLDEARRVLVSGTKIASSNTQILVQLALVELAAGDTLKARTLARRARQISKIGLESANAHSVLGRIYEQDGSSTDAIRELRRARDHAPNKLRYRLELARLLEKVGDLDGAASELDRAVADLGDSGELERARSRVADRRRARTGP